MDMFEMTSGQRMIASYMRIGGVSEDLPEEFYPAVRSFLKACLQCLRNIMGLYLAMKYSDGPHKTVIGTIISRGCHCLWSKRAQSQSQRGKL